MQKKLTRRQILKTSALASFGFWAAGCEAITPSTGPSTRPVSPNEKLNIGFVGVANRADRLTRRQWRTEAKEK